MRQLDSTDPATLSPKPDQPAADRLTVLQNLSTEQLIQGIILSEVLGPPVSRGHRRMR